MVFNVDVLPFFKGAGFEAVVFAFAPAAFILVDVGLVFVSAVLSLGSPLVRLGCGDGSSRDAARFTTRIGGAALDSGRIDLLGGI